MPSKKSLRIDLRRLILVLAVLSALGTLANGLYAAYRVQRQVLIDHSLQTSRAYSAKVASGIDEFLRSAQQQLAYSAGILGRRFGDQEVMKAEVLRLQQQDRGFNAVGIADAAGRVLAATPDGMDVDGKILKSPGVEDALALRRPTISQAYNTDGGTLVVFISNPIVAANGDYLGFVGGAIYLRQEGILHTLIGSHYYQGDVRAYVVDGNRRLLYHTDASRVGQLVGANPAVDAVLEGQDGMARILNSEGQDVLAGYADVSLANWGVVAQQNSQVVLAGLNGLMKQVLIGIAPLSLLGLAMIWWLTSMISRPLNQLAEAAHQMTDPATPERIRGVRSWYFEAEHIRHALLKGLGLMQEKLGKLNTAATTDPLTGLLNRRAMTEALATLEETQRPFSVIVLDIDHFKRVNDTYGHDAGDEVLATLGALIRQCSRSGDLPCRVGGEEFTLLVPGAAVDTAVQVGERLRRLVEQARLDRVGTITISLGVARWQPGTGSVADALKQADERMYLAKRQGRNRLVADDIA